MVAVTRNAVSDSAVALTEVIGTRSAVLDSVDALAGVALSHDRYYFLSFRRCVYVYLSQGFKTIGHAFPISYYLGIHTSLGVIGIWIGLLSGLTASAVLLLWRFNYMTKKLIVN